MSFQRLDPASPVDRTAYANNRCAGRPCGAIAGLAFGAGHGVSPIDGRGMVPLPIVTSRNSGHAAGRPGGGWGAGTPRRSSSSPRRSGPSCWRVPRRRASAACGQQRPQPFRHQPAARLHRGIDHRGGARDEQRPQPFIAGPADAAHALLAAGGMFLRRQTDPGGQVAAGFERRRIDLDRTASAR